MAGIIDLRLHSFGNLEFITRIPMSVQAGLTGDIINFVICVIAFFIIGYFVAYFMIGKFRYATPGRLGNYTDENASDDEGRRNRRCQDIRKRFSGRKPGGENHRAPGRTGKYRPGGRLHDPAPRDSEGSGESGLTWLHGRQRAPLDLSRRTGESRRSTDPRPMCSNPISMISCDNSDGRALFERRAAH